MPEQHAESSVSPQATRNRRLKRKLTLFSTDETPTLLPSWVPQPALTREGRRWVIRFFHPHATSASVQVSGLPGPIEARKRRDQGLFEATLPENYRDRPDAQNYRIRYQTHEGDSFEQYDTYAFPYSISEFDLYLMGEGRHYDTYEKLGAHVMTSRRRERGALSRCGRRARSA